MANANVIEIEACLKDSLSFCEANSDIEFVRYYHPRLAQAARQFHEAVRESDLHYINWRRESDEDKLTWKHLGNAYLSTQRTLSRQNAVGYPEVRLRHWDEEALAGFVRQMIAYLDERKATIEGAAGMSDRLQRLLSRAAKEDKEESEAFKNYQRYATQRATAYGMIGANLSDFRGAMRRHFGKRDERYLSVRWPLTLNSDESVL